MIKKLTFAGYSGSGKTTLLVKVIEELSKRGIKVAAIKHDGHNFEMDKEGKDTYRLKQAGAQAVAISSKNKYALISDSDHRLTFDEITQLIPNNIDIIIGEGFKDENIQKILVHRKENNKENLYNDEKNIIAVATNCPDEFKNVKNVFDINDYISITEFIINYK